VKLLKDGGTITGRFTTTTPNFKEVDRVRRFARTEFDDTLALNAEAMPQLIIARKRSNVWPLLGLGIVLLVPGASIIAAAILLLRKRHK
jgi:hypothetical protein